MTATTDPPLPRYMTVSQVADLLQTTPSAIYSMRSRGQLPGAMKFGGGRLLYHRDTLIAYLEGLRER